MPDDEDSEEWKKLSELKQDRFNKKVKDEDYNFQGVIFGDLIFHGEFKQVVSFFMAKFSGDASFREATFSGDASFREATFSGDTIFFEATFSGDAQFYRATFSGDGWFDEATFSRDAQFYRATFSGDAQFYRATFSGNARFDEATFSGDTIFFEATFSGDASFREATFSGNTNFILATFSVSTRFSGATFSRDTWFDGATFFRDAQFYRATFSGDAQFYRATFSGYTNFLLIIITKGFYFEQSKFECLLHITAQESGDTTKIKINQIEINGDFVIDLSRLGKDSSIELIGTKVEGNFSLYDTIIEGKANFNNLDVSGDIEINPKNIRNPYAQENIFRKVKTHAAELGDKKTSDEFFYLEKEAGKKILWLDFEKSLEKLSKPVITKTFLKNLIDSYTLFWKYLFEWPIHYYFRYGVRPGLTFVYWFIVIVFFAYIYWQFSLIQLSSIWDYLYFSITNAMTPGYGGIIPDSGTPRFVASVEAIFGAFTWGCFLAIFARKYMDK